MNDDLDPRVRAAFRGARVPGASPALREAVRRIPLEEGMPGSAGKRDRRAVRLVGGLVAAAAVVGLLLVPVLAGDRLGFGPAASPPASGPSAVAPTSPSPVQSAVPSSSTSMSESESQSPEAAASAPAPAASAPPLDFAVSSASFATSQLGWAVGTGKCDSGSCLWVLRTADGGETWSAATAPMPDPGASVGRRTAILFANERDGWLYGPGLWSTHDGGATWARVSIPGVPATASVPSVSAAGGVVSAAILPDSGPVRVATSKVAADTWTVASVSVQPGAGPVPSPQVVRAAPSDGAGGPSAGWLIEVDRTVVGGLRDVAGEWVAWTPPCLDAVGPALLAAADAKHVAALCDVGLWSTPQGIHLAVSTDGGATFAPGFWGAQVPFLRSLAAAAASGDTILATDGSDIVGSFDGGQYWEDLWGSPQGNLVDLHFTDVQHVFVVAATGGPDGALARSEDGGRTWIYRPYAFLFSGPIFRGHSHTPRD